MRDQLSCQFERYYPISELNYKHLISVYYDNIFPFFRELNVFPMENFKISSDFRPLQRMSRMTKHVRKAGKVDPGDMVTLPVKITCESELTLTRWQG